MTDLPVLTPEEEVQRAEQAEQIILNPVYIEACQRIEEGLAGQRQRVPMNATDSHTRLILLEQLWTQLRDYIAQVAETGKFAKLAIEEAEQRKKTLLERILSGQFRE